MSEKQYYQYSTAVPIIVPIPVIAAVATLSRLGWDTDLPVPPWMSDIISLVGFSLIYGGLPYIVFTLALLWFFRKRDVSFYRRFSWFFPVVFSAFFLVCFSIWWVIEGQVYPFLFNVLFYTVCIFVLGYAYVILIHLVFFTLRGLGCLEAQQSETAAI